MNDRVMHAPRRYDTTVDRAGVALGAGSALGGLVALGLLLSGGNYDPATLATGWVLGTVCTAIGLVAVAGPIWLIMHVAGLRRAHHAALVTGLAALALLVGAQTYGFGLFEMPAMDGRTLMVRWLSALLTSLILAVVAGGIGLVMWRIAYRRNP